ncbi:MULTISPECIES: phosphopantetheine-binding protein [unclassified Methylobacterium]|uniref:acyl carrier protein n=1 Tax=unclassified Methylobacterium TaxID=2615210 RepID=UPI0011C9DB1F|nr:MULTISPECIES: phosphopantetheine-binding protein [unclassified Methylobacterium]TXM67630.1 acyl carrier protein [Methylobacterium sp. WL120]TXN84662.1 acyl carrier protein [Methylobacterium sp. WL8]
MISSAAVVTTNPAAIDAVAAAGADDVEVRLFEIFRKYLKVEDVRWDSATTMEEAQIDSLDLVEVIFEIEDQFGVEVNFNANAKPAAETTFGDVVGLIRSALAAKARRA